jgi:hypothetical protein
MPQPHLTTPESSTDSSYRSKPNGMWLSVPGFAVLLCFVVLPWVLIATGVLPKSDAKAPQAKPAAPTQTAAATEHRTGEWGDLELIRLTTIPSEELMAPGWSKTAEVSWFFPEYSTDSLREFLESLELSDKQRANLLNADSWTTESDGLTLRPDTETILSLTPAVRDAIYSVLARTSRNMPQHVPWSIRTEDFEPALAASGLATETQDTIRRVAFQRGNRTCVSDAITVLNTTDSIDEKLVVSRLLSSASTYLVKLHVPHGADIDHLSAYWCGRGRRKDLRPLLEALAALPNGGTLDIAHLLPAFGRQRLYIYPHPSLARDGVTRDCHWTSLNFFNLTPDDQMGISEYAQRHIVDQYYRISETPRFGDLVFFSLKNGNIIHSCVYLAANLVFTKNGDSVFQPWSIMDLDDVKEIYSYLSPDGVELQYWRNRSHED